MFQGRRGVWTLLLVSSLVAVGCGDGQPPEGSSNDDSSGLPDEAAGGATTSHSGGSGGSGATTSGGGGSASNGGAGGGTTAGGTGGTTSTGGSSSTDLGTLTLELNGVFIDFDVTFSASVANYYRLVGVPTNNDTIASIEIFFFGLGPGTYGCATSNLEAYISLTPVGAPTADAGLSSLLGDSCALELPVFGNAGQRLVGTFAGELAAENGSTATITNGVIDVLRTIAN